VEKMRYRKGFYSGILVILFCILLFGAVIVFFIVSKIQYDRLVVGMEPLEATVVDVDRKVTYKGPREQEIRIAYEVDGVSYEREWKTDTPISFSPGRGTNYSIGDRIEILYDPESPGTIVAPRSMRVGIFYLTVALIGMALVLFSLFCVIKTRHQFLVTQEEYDREREAQKRIRSEKRAQKREAQKRIRSEKRAQKREARARGTVWLKRVVKWALIALVVWIVGALLFHFFKGFVRGLSG